MRSAGVFITGPCRGSGRGQLVGPETGRCPGGADRRRPGARTRCRVVFRDVRCEGTMAAAVHPRRRLLRLYKASLRGARFDIEAGIAVLHGALTEPGVITIVSKPIGAPARAGGDRHENQTDRHRDGGWVAPAPGRCECASRIRSRPESGRRADLERCAYRGELWAPREPGRPEPHARPLRRWHTYGPWRPARPVRQEPEQTALGPERNNIKRRTFQDVRRFPLGHRKSLDRGLRAVGAVVVP